MTERIGAVSYLNTKPLIYGLERSPLGRHLVLDLPSRLADRLAKDDLDVALIPSVEFLRAEDLAIVSDACIACQGAVRSVQLLFRKPPAEVQSLALDEGSRTSVALAQVLLHQELKIVPELHPLPIDAPLDSVSADALLVIGDRAMQLDPRAYEATWDLGAKWFEVTGLPFVFATWAAKEGFAGQALADTLRVSRDEGLVHLEEIIAREALAYGLTAADCRLYFQKQLHFHLGPRELAGLELFRSLATELGLVPEQCTHLTLAPL